MADRYLSVQLRKALKRRKRFVKHRDAAQKSIEPTRVAIAEAGDLLKAASSGEIRTALKGVLADLKEELRYCIEDVDEAVEDLEEIDREIASIKKSLAKTTRN